MMTDINAEVRRFVAAWNDPDADRRAEVIDALFAPDARYCNASEEFSGRQACQAALTRTYDEFVSKGFEFASVGDAGAHQDAVVFRWEMEPADGGEIAATGRMFGLLDQSGRVTRLYQFMDA